MKLDQLNFPDGLDKAAFLRDYWQKQPLLMRAALPDFRSPLTPDELAGLACEDEIESRIVLEKDGERPWEARLGPFDEDDFAAMPDTHWTLLVQDADKHVPDVTPLLEPFRFVPDWRVDDIMISYAPDQGSVGPHVDDYDVFLVQAYGRRRWRIHGKPVAEDDYIPGLDLRILPDFDAEQDWLMEPGDVLYLPPNVAHWGVAEGECMTYSVGFRAPELNDLARFLAEKWIERHIRPGRYRDENLRLQPDSAEIDDDALHRLIAEFDGLPFARDIQFRAWIGRYLTETKDNIHLEPAEDTLTPDELAGQIEQLGGIHRSGYARMAFCRGEAENALLFVNGVAYSLPEDDIDFLRLITGERRLDSASLSPWLHKPECLDLMCRLYNEGSFEFADD